MPNTKNWCKLWAHSSSGRN